MFRCRIEHIDQSDAIHLRVKQRVPHRTAHRHLRRLMADGIGPFGCEGFRHCLAVHNIDFMQRHILGQVFPRSAGEVVKNSHAMASRKQAIDNMAANESSATRHKDLHAALLLKTVSYTRTYPWAVLAHENESAWACS